MAEQKTKTAPKKATAARDAGTVAGKPVTAKAGKVAMAKKPGGRKTNCEEHCGRTGEAGKSQITCRKKVASPAAKKKTVALPAAGDTDKLDAIRQRAAKPGPEILYRMVETAAYFIAEQHGFKGHPHDHWLAAEREIVAKLGCSADMQHQPAAT